MKISMNKLSIALFGIGILFISSFLWTYIQANNGGEITVCVKENGAMYLIGEGFKRTECKGKQQLLSWNTQGLQGEKGEKGEKGDKGDPGEPSWDEARIAALEARITALENPPPPSPCSAILCEDFNSYVDGPIVNQGWTNRANGLTYLIQGNVVQEGAKALQNISNSTDNVITKNGNAFADGRQSVWVRTKDRANWGNYNIGENVQFCLLKGSWDGPARTCLAFMKDGHVAFLDQRGVDTWTNFDSYTDNTWNLVEIEWRSVDRTARFRANNGTWTGWMPLYNAGAFTDFDTVGFDTFLLGSGGVYFDNLH